MPTDSRQRTFAPNQPNQPRPAGAPTGQPQGAASRALTVPPPSAPLPAITVKQVPGLFSKLEELSAFLGEVSARAFILGPVVQLDHIPEFHEISVRYVRVDPRPENGDVYVQDKTKPEEVALTVVALNRIAGAAGISWDPVNSGRLDNASDPNYCHFRAVGVYRDIDGSPHTLVGEREINLRSGNPAIFSETGYQQGWSDKRIDGAREHILAMCESKSRNRATRSLGIRQKYTKAELLQKPFVVIRPIFTGRTEDPILQAEAKRLLMAKMISDTFGPPRAIEGRTERGIGPALERHDPPPLEQASDPGDEGAHDVTEARCGCPDGPVGIHVEGCPEAAA